jgi:phosphatidylglycerophosphatase A
MHPFLAWLTNFISTGAYIGYVPRTPGTAASLVTVFALWAIAPQLSLGTIIIFVVLLFFATWAAHGELVRHNQGCDPSHIVIDEIMGMALVCLVIPHQWVWYGVAFSLFRFFDIAKPGVIKRFEQLPGAWGVMLDDLAAATATIVVCLLSQRY